MMDALPVTDIVVGEWTRKWSTPDEPSERGSTAKSSIRLLKSKNPDLTNIQSGDIREEATLESTDAPTAPPRSVEVVDSCNVDIANISETEGVAFLDFERDSGARRYCISLVALENSGAMHPREGDKYIFSVYKMKTGVYGRFAKRSDEPEPLVSDSEIQYFPSVDDLEAYFQKPRSADK